MTELKDIVDNINKDWSSYKKTNDELMAGKADSKTVLELKSNLEKIDASMTASQEKLKTLEVSIKRSLESSQGSGNAMEINEKVLRKGFRHWLRKGGGQQGGHQDSFADHLNDVFNKDVKMKEAYFEDHPEFKALSVNDDTAGGFMVHADLSGRIVKRIFETSPLRQYASVQNISTDALEGMIDAQDTAYGWVTEQGSRGTTANPKIGMWRIPVHEMYAQPAVTQKLLDDAAWDPESWLTGKVADKFARVENAAFVLGTGDGMPKGFLVENTITDASNASATYDSYITDQKIGYIPTGAADAFPAIPDTGDAAQANPIIDMVYAMKSEYRDRPGTAFAMHRTTLAGVRKLQDAFGNYLWQPGLVGQPSTLFSYPIAEFNDMPVLGAANKYAIAFANWREAYQIVDRIGIRILRDPFTAKPFILFYTTKRVGGKLLNFEAIKLLKFATT